ncbi:MAG: hypothetical protein K2N35_07455 [Muribaculaceae bacterium]|nr:hypothetical protein [Muribaculaceae bacterium]
MNTPDFAFPKTVEKNASANLEKAIAHGDWSAAVEALIQSVTAQNMVSYNNADNGIAKIDSVAAMAPEAWCPAFMLIKLEIYNSIYNSIRWKADRREIPTDSIPENPNEWSRKIFALKTFEICKSILDSPIPANLSIKDWSKFLENTSDAYSNGMTVEEYVCNQCFKDLDVYSDASQDIIPFFPNKAEAVTPTQKCAALRDKAIDRLIQSAAEGKRMLILAKALSDKTNTLTHSMRMTYLMSALDKVKGSEGEQLILSDLRDYVSEDPIPGIESPFPFTTKEYIEELRKSVAQFPNGMYVNNLKNIINDLTRPFAKIRFKSQYLSSANIEMDVKLTNCNESWVLVYDYSPYVNAERSPKTREVAAKCRLVKATKVSATGEVPFSSNEKASIGSLPKGNYVVIPSATADSKGIYSTILNDTWRQPFSVSDISVMTLPYPDAVSRVFVVDGVNGKPIEGAEVKVYTKKNYSTPRTLINTLTTDKDGGVTVNAERFDIEASYKGSKWKSDSQYYNSTYRQDTTSRRFAQILTNRAIFHPGDSISAAIVAYSSKNFNKWLDKEKEVKIELRDANYKIVATDSIITDNFGRASVDFELPAQGLLGNWQLIAYDENARRIGNVSFQVADYVAPTFFITSDHSDEDVAPGDVVLLKGQVLTYSGMPVSGASVKYNVNYRPPMRWHSYSNASYDSSVTTDAEGRYEIELPTANLKGTQFERGVYSVNLSATSPAGETQSGPTERFALGKEFHIRPSFSDLKMDISDSIPDMIYYVKDMLDRNVKKELSYKLVNNTSKATVAEGSFMSPILNLPKKDYPSALYTIKVTLKEDTLVQSEMPIVFWRKSDKTAPEGTGLWVPQTNVTAESGQTEVKVTVGSSISDRWIPAVVSENGKILSMQWLHVEKDNLSVPVGVPASDHNYMLNLTYLSELNLEIANLSIYPASAKDKLSVATESFRDKISAGDKEKWSFRFYRPSGKVSEIPAIAVMSDAALNALTPFQWTFYPISNGYSSFYRMHGDFNDLRNYSYSLKDSKYLRYTSFSFPHLNDYGQDWGLYSIRYGGDVAYVTGVVNEMAVMRSSAPAMKMMAKAAPTAAEEVAMADIAMDDGVMDYAVEVEEDQEESIMIRGNGDGGGSASTDTPDLRETECPVAFFMPYLISDKDGIVNIDFTVPNFNTTWAFQLLGYDESLQVANTTLEAVASKPIMVSTHAPRFVRTGDVITLTATVFNNSDATCSPKCRIELVDLISGKTIEAKDFNPGPIAVAENSLISLQWTVPSDVSSIGFRAYAEANNHSDGEQALVPVLPASSPVVESTPFWIAPDGQEVEVKLPKFKDTDQVTLQYCDNPAWYCLTALPDIVVPDSKSVTSKMQALFGNAIAYHLISSNANLKTGLETMLSDKNSQLSALKSNLQKDGNLKITQLNNTPWVNNAESETLRMSRLSSLLSDTTALKAIGDILGDVRSLQDRSGGWSWCPDMQPSPYITRNVLSKFAMILKAGAIEHLEGATPMVKSAIRYVDSEAIKDYKKYHMKGESLSYLLDWLYVRSTFPTDYLPKDAVGTDMTSIANKAYKDIAKEWKDLGIGSKAKAATLLWRAGDHKTSNEILESLRQFASESPEKGMWFDNLNSGWGGMNTLQTTTLVLEAFVEIQPANKIVDSLRQWLVLGRQYQDWGSRSFIVETVNAILTSGTDWTESSSANTPEFHLKGEKLAIPAAAKLTGAFTMNLDAKDASKKTLTISGKGNSPAWGGVISQYESPILDVVAADMPELSIRKSIVALVQGDNGELTPKEGITLTKGMKVRVTLFINADRDMDYVAVTDERSACLEPVDQLSGYTASDGIGFYREVRDTNTNLFFGWLPKGLHVVSYDCTVSQEGTFSCGIATAQSQYSPTAVAHSAGSLLHVK